MSTPTEKISSIARLAAKEGQRDALLAAFEAFLPAVEAEEGTEIYSLHLDEADPNLIWVFELYTDRAALEAHAGSPAFMEFLGAAGPLIGDAPGLYTAVPALAKGLDL
jgi:quinol monooxygenase YgiN